MKVIAGRNLKLFRAALGATLVSLCGLLLWKMPFGDAWVNSSYDYLFRFGSRTVTNKVALILLDNEAYDQLNQVRGLPWDLTLHSRLLQRLAADGCALVVFDAFLRQHQSPAADEALAEAIRQQRVVLMAKQVKVTHPGLTGARPVLPSEPFLSAAGNWGVAWLDPDLDSIVRRHWPFPNPGPYPSLPWKAAELAGAKLSAEPEERWLRYYGREVVGTRLSYRFALTQPTNYFRDQIVFIGSQPKTSVADYEPDEFSTPYTRWTGETTSGVEIMLASFLNLTNDSWLRRPVWWVEATALIATGILLGGGLCRMRPMFAVVAAGLFGAMVSLAAVSLSYFTNYWVPWLVVVGGQLPCALAWAVATTKIQSPRAAGRDPATRVQTRPGGVEDLPETPDYELVNPPFGEGAYGKIWLARNAVGQWQALKVVYAARFADAVPYDREFNGIRKYKPVSDKHPGLLRVDFVSKKRLEYFYYVMELGDALEPGWEPAPSKYKPRDLASERKRFPGRRLPVPECLRIGLELSDALDFLHREGLTHRDIKPQNIIYVNGRPKLADIGLLAEIRPPDQESTFVGTPSYMPPLPERPGTVQADIYALGMVLYVLSTGHNATSFPEIPTPLVAGTKPNDFLPLNTVILKACHPDGVQRYATAAELHRALQEVGEILQR